MPTVIFENGALSLVVKHLLLKNGVWFYYRRIPSELRRHYGGKRHIRKSLKTGDARVAAKKTMALASADDALWTSMRTPEAQEVGLTTPANRSAALRLLEVLELKPGDANRRPGPGEVFEYVLDEHFRARYGGDYQDVRENNEPLAEILTPVELEAVRLVLEDPEKPRVLMSDALALYLKSHDKGSQTKFARDTTRAIEKVTVTVGDLPLSAYRRQHANAVRDHLIAKGLKTRTVRRQLNTINAIFNKGLAEFDLAAIGNPFARLEVPREGRDARKPPPFTDEQLKTIAATCKTADDDIRYIIAIQLDTGARLGEVVGLRLEDLVLDHPVPHVYLRFHEELGRTLKNRGSERKVPLVGIALWGAQRAVEAARSARSASWLFPRYSADHNIRSTHAANTANKWLKGLLKDTKTTHSFRHAMRDRLRRVNTPEELIDRVGGWSTRTVGMGYGEEDRLKEIKAQLEKIVFT